MKGAAVFVGLVIAAVACTEDETTIPVRPAPPSRTAALVALLDDDARGYAVAGGDWLEDRDDAPFWGLATLAGQGGAREAAVARDVALLDGAAPIEQRVTSLLGLLQDDAATKAQRVAIDRFVSELDGLLRAAGDFVRTPPDGYGPTAATAALALAFAEYALRVGGTSWTARAVAIDARIRGLAFGDRVDLATRRQVRAYSAGPDEPGLAEAPNVAMLLLKTRLFRLTRDEVFRIEARSLFGALEILPLPETLAGRSYRALAYTLLFEITGEQRYIDAADRVLDAVAALRGAYCSTTGRCATGLVHHAGAAEFCAGCALQARFTTGYRRRLANEPF